ncbi:MAG: hypothetical protein H7X88_07220 [Gloeobacteraceae cyanobacterium ES-bin-316]|nr:hypothetical protein [Ferruginibacter sp.]
MNLGTIVKFSFITSILSTIGATFLMLIHSPGAETWLLIAVVVSLVFIVSAIYEVATSKRIDGREKTMWTIALIFFSAVAGLMYLLMGRKRIAENLEDFRAYNFTKKFNKSSNAKAIQMAHKYRWV